MTGPTTAYAVKRATGKRPTVRQLVEHLEAMGREAAEIGEENARACVDAAAILRRKADPFRYVFEESR